jgi:citronellol/citronellal dehydrogenase
LKSHTSRVFADGILVGQVALVTGGGTNLGKAAAAELARCGASVVIAGRREDVLQEASNEIGPSASWVSADIRTHEGADAIVRQTLDRHGHLDFVLNNAGGQYFAPAEAIAVKGWRAVQRLNVNGTLAMCLAAHRLAMQPAGTGTIVNVTVSPHQGFPAMAHTGAARAAVEALTCELAAEWAPEGVSLAAMAASRRTRCGSTRPSSGAERRSPCRSSASGRSRSTAGSSRCSPRRSAPRSRAR